MSIKRIKYHGPKICILLAASIFAAGCGAGSLYKVKPVVESPAVRTDAASAKAAGIDVRAAAILTDEESFELFETNLPLMGLLPVRVEMANGSGAVFALEHVRFHLREGDAGKEWKLTPPKKVVARILKADEVTLYNPNSRTRFEEELSAHALDLKSPLAASERRQGLIFFQTPKKEAVSSPQGLKLTVEGLPQAVELRLN